MPAETEKYRWMYETMVLIRYYEETMARVYMEGKLPPAIQKGLAFDIGAGPVPGEMHLAAGQEPDAVGIGGGYGDAAQHSQCLYATFAHMPGMKVVVPSNAYDAKGLMVQAIRDNNPVIFMYHKGIMGVAWMAYFEGSSNEVPEDSYTIEFGKANVLLRGSDLTIVTISQMVQKAVLAAKELVTHDIFAEVIDLRTLVPMDTETILKSVRKTGRLLVVDEDYLGFGLSGEISAVIAENLDSISLKSPIKRLAVPNVPIPYSRPLEEFVIPQVSSIVLAAQELMLKKIAQIGSK